MQTGCFTRRSMVAAAAGLAASTLLVGAAEAASPFTTLNGTWSGSGRIEFENGKSERLRCTAYYTSSNGGNGLGLAIRCASASNKIEVRGRLDYRNGRVSGVWEERTFNASGTATGQASDNRVSLRLAGSIPGSMNVNVSKTRQSVAINTQASGLRAIRIGLSRR